MSQVHVFSVFENTSGTTENLTESNVKSRALFYGSCFIALGVVLVAVGFLAVYRKTGSLWTRVPDGEADKEEEPHGNLGLIRRLLLFRMTRVPDGKADKEEDLYELDKIDDDRLIEFLLQAQEPHGNWGIIRRILLSSLLLMYVGVCVGIPAHYATNASCTHGFFWEVHMVFVADVFITKVVEVILYVHDKSILGQLELIPFMMIFLPSLLGYIDAYLDATAIVIARSCPGEFAQALSNWMLITYVLGVVYSQWVLVGMVACTDGTQACVMKLLHMDMLASCMTLPREAMWKLWIINAVRTFLEDLLQGVYQLLFVIVVRPNPLMILSVLIAMLSSFKSLYEALNRKPIGVNAYKTFQSLQRMRMLDGTLTLREAMQEFRAVTKTGTLLSGSHQPSEEAVKHMCRLLVPFFRKYDRDEDNQIGFEDFKLIANDLGGIPEEKAKTIFKAADMDNAGAISFEEFVAVILAFAVNMPDPPGSSSLP